MRRLWKRLKEKGGQSLVEYVLILTFVAMVVIAALTAFGGKVEATMGNVANAV